MPIKRIGIVVGGGQNVTSDVTARGGGSEFIFATTEWGAILAQGRFEIFNAAWIALVPAAAFASAVLGFNLMGHGLRTFFERAPVALGKLLSLRTAMAVLAIFIAMNWGFQVTLLVASATYLMGLCCLFAADRAR